MVTPGAASQWDRRGDPLKVCPPPQRPYFGPSRQLPLSGFPAEVDGAASPL